MTPEEKKEILELLTPPRQSYYIIEVGSGIPYLRAKIKKVTKSELVGNIMNLWDCDGLILDGLYEYLEVSGLDMDTDMAMCKKNVALGDLCESNKEKIMKIVQTQTQQEADAQKFINYLEDDPHNPLIIVAKTPDTRCLVSYLDKPLIHG